jgi:Domain of unknown function (DUF4349)/Putative zinc-finger
MRSNPHLAHHPIDQEEVMAYLDGELPVEQATAIAAHLGECSDCQRLAADLKQVSEAMVSWEIEPVGDEIAPAVAAALNRSETKGAQPLTIRPRFSSLRRVKRWALGVPVAAFAVLLFIIAIAPRSRTLQYSNTVPQMYSAAPQPSTMRDKAVLAPPSRMKFRDELLSTASSSASLPPTGSVATRPPAPMIARTADITLTAKDFAKTCAALDDLLRRRQGYMGQLNVNTPTDGVRSLTATLHVPADQLDPALADLRNLGRVQSESQSGEEVSAQYVDLEARLQNARNTEQRLTALLSQRTGKLSDVLEVETEASRVRGEIESMEAEKKLLDARITFATLNVIISEEFKAQMRVVPDSIGSRFRNAAIDGYQSAVSGLIAFLLFLVAYGPSLLLWTAILFIPTWLLWKRLRRKKAKAA